MNLLKFSLILVLLCAAISPSYADTHVDTSLLGVGTGIAGLLDSHKIVLGAIEYRPKMQWLRLRPWMGLEMGYDLFYASGGVLAHFALGEKWFLTPSFGVGLYSSKEGIKLGSPIEFKSSIELGYKLKNRHIAGLSFSHISNGGLDENNPGSEMLKICYYLPLSK